MAIISYSEWLDFFRFRRDPFALTEAAQEVDYWTRDGANEAAKEVDYRSWSLADRLVKPDCFDRVLGQASDPQSVIVFAPRGGGKTACRILLDYYAREGIGQGDRSSDETGGRVLPVLHTHLHEVLYQAQGDIRLVDEHTHVIEILQRTMLTLTGLLQRDIGLVERLRSLSFSKQVDLEWFFQSFSTYLSLEQSRFLRNELDFRAFSFGEQGGGELGFRAKPASAGAERLSMSDIAHLEARSGMSPIYRLQMLTELTGDLGFRAFYVIVDGLDEFIQTADLSTGGGVVLLASLLANLDLMNNTPRLAFKFFVPAELEAAVRSASALVRRDRLAFEYINWTDNGLQEILRRRLIASSERGAVRSLDVVSVPELRGRVERELIQECRQNPRFLIWLARFMIESHCDTELPGTIDELSEETYLLNQSDLERAIVRFNSGHF